MFGKSIKWRFILPVTAVLVVSVLAMLMVTAVRFTAYRDETDKTRLLAATSNIKTELLHMERISRVAAEAVAAEPGLAAAIANSNISAIETVLAKAGGLYGADYYTVSDSDGVLAGEYRYITQSIASALSGEVFTCYEQDAQAKAVVTTDAPVYDANGAVIGAVSVGLRLDTDDFLLRLKDTSATETGIYLAEQLDAQDTQLEPSVVEAVFAQKTEYYTQNGTMGNRFTSVYIPILEPDGEVFAIIFASLVEDTTVFNFVALDAGIGILALLAVIAITVIAANSVTMPVLKLYRAFEELSEGEFADSIDVSGDDEIGRLGGCFLQLKDVLNKLLCDINKMVDEREKGDIDYFINADEFKGAYRRLADDVFKLINTSHNDTLSLVNVLMEFGKGNFNADVPRMPGKKYIMNQTIDSIRNSLTGVRREIGTLTEHALNGNLSARADVQNYGGEWQEILNELNRLMDTILAPIEEAASSLAEIAKGNLDVRMVGDYKGDYAVIKDSLNMTAETISQYVDEIAGVLDELANNHKLNQEITRTYYGNFDNIKQSLNNIIGDLNRVMREIGSASEHVAAGARQVSGSGEMLAQGASEQAASVDELANIIMLVNEQTRLNAENARAVERLSEQAAKNAIVGNEEMKRVLKAMNDIEEASANISNIIRVIDDIAFQTNLLALNAAVEAARAREHGAGFAVVADEVRNLAGRSQEAARETAELIENSIESVGEGLSIVNFAAGALEQILADATEVSEIISRITNASVEQETAISRLNEEVNQISGAVQNASAASEENASAAKDLSGQSELLNEMINIFELRDI